MFCQNKILIVQILCFVYDENKTIELYFFPRKLHGTKMFFTVKLVDLATTTSIAPLTAKRFQDFSDFSAATNLLCNSFKT